MTTNHLHRLKFNDVAPKATHMQVKLIEQVKVVDVSFIDRSLVLRLLLFIPHFQHVNLGLKFFIRFLQNSGLLIRPLILEEISLVDVINHVLLLLHKSFHHLNVRFILLLLLLSAHSKLLVIMAKLHQFILGLLLFLSDVRQHDVLFPKLISLFI